MAETLILRLSARDDQISWVVTADDGSIVSSGAGSLAEAATQAEQRRVIALAPAASVLRVAVNIPLKGAAKIRQALPFALEEQVAGDIEAQHFAFSKADANGRIPVAVIADTLMARWINAAREADLHLDGLFAESDGIPALPATVSVLIDGDDVIVRDQQGEFTVTDTETMPVVLEMLLDQHAEQMESDAAQVPVNLLIYCSEDEHRTYADSWDRLRMRSESVESKLLANGVAAFLGEQLTRSSGINLLQGDYAPRSELNIDLTPWKLPGALAAGLLVIVLVLQGINYWQLTREEAALDAAAAQVLQQTFPAAGTEADPWNTLQTRLGSSGTADSTTLGAGPGFSEALQVLASAYGKSTGIKVQTLGYRSGILDIQLIAPNVNALDKLRQQIDDSGSFAATIQSANPDKDVIKGRMQITVAQQ